MDVSPEVYLAVQSPQSGCCSGRLCRRTEPCFPGCFPLAKDNWFSCWDLRELDLEMDLVMIAEEPRL